MRPEFVVLDPLGLGLLGERERVIDLVKVEPLVFQRAEAALTRAVLTGCLHSGAHMDQLGMGGNE